MNTTPSIEPRVETRTRRAFDVWNEVPLVPQLTGMSCWAAAAAMVVGWRDCVPVEPLDLAKGAGHWAAYRDGLNPSDLDELARVFGLAIEPSSRLSVTRLVELLERVGPLWIGEASPGLHSIVVTGVSGDGSPERTLVRINDPWPAGRGERYVLSFAEFLHNFRAAADVVGEHAQVLHAAGGRGGRGRAASLERRSTTRVGPSTQENVMSMQSHYESSYGKSYGTATCAVCKPYVASAEGLGAVAAGEAYLESSTEMSPDPLAKHATSNPQSSGANLFLRWNAMPSDVDQVDVVVHFHGYDSGAPDGKLLRSAKVPESGADLSSRTRPTLVIVPRGRKITPAEIEAECNATPPSCPNKKRYKFPALTSHSGFSDLIRKSLDYFAATCLGGQVTPSIGRLILSCHSGGGAAVSLLLPKLVGTSLMPNDVFVYDAIYKGQQHGFKTWLKERLKDPTTGSLRIFYTSPKEYSLAVFAGETIPSAQAGFYRVESTKIGHIGVGTRIGPKLLGDASADVLDSSGAALARYGTPVGLFRQYAPAGGLQASEYSPEEVDQLIAEGQSLPSARARPFVAPPATWAIDSMSPDYRHVQSFPGKNLAFALTGSVLRELADANHFDLGVDRFVIYALRGATIVEQNDGNYHASVNLDDDIPDHHASHCVIGVWDRTNDMVCAFTGSTVPNVAHMTKQFDGTGNANMPVTGLHLRVIGTHRGKVHGVLRQHGSIVGIRSNDDLTYTTIDQFDSGDFGDNLHPSFRRSDSTFSSAGCLTIRGTAHGRTHNNPDDGTPGWLTFRQRLGISTSPSLDSEDGTVFKLMMLTGREAQVLAAGRGTQTDLVRLRFGSSGPDVMALQTFLANRGLYAGPIDGSMGPGTVLAWVAFQRARDVAAGVPAASAAADGIVTPTDARAAGFIMVASGAPGGQSTLAQSYGGRGRVAMRRPRSLGTTRPLVYRGFDHYGRVRAIALVDERSSQAEQSTEIRKNVGRTLAQWESGNKFDILHYDSGRVNVGIGSWTGSRIAELMDNYERVATDAGTTATLYGYFGSQAAFNDVRSRFRADGAKTVITTDEETAFRDAGGDATLQQAQIDQRAKDVSKDLDFIGSDGNPWYPFTDGGVGAISEVSAHVLVHAMHQSGNAGFRQRLRDAIAHFGGDTKLGEGMVDGTITELDFLAQVAEQVIANVGAKYKKGVRNRYDDVMKRFGGSKLAYYFSPA